MTEQNNFGIAETVTPPSDREALIELINQCSDLTQCLYAFLTPHTYKKIYRTATFQNFVEAIREAERAIGKRAPRTKIVPAMRSS